ncbi:LacI family DNA-binding transcriptional regulator [Azotobacter vinelandii]|uniref:LacI family DNA-binding transcriptional regulator n=1 Tax=Azotobacter vinelandii TaxID=354 RepID=UPI002665195B|nr:LacI family DNA-binding transcriptional regulator [Azotobacter vinelandii]WKN21859.1 LacI family DNA-binding transcriptional regulator [Azotobacter vinelandii]
MPEPVSPPPRRPTLQDVARAAGVSLSTVDRVINLRANVRADTARRIAEAAARLGFHGRGVIEQRLLEQRRTVRLGFLLWKRNTAFYRGLADGLAEAAAACVRAQVRVTIGYLDNLDPEATAARMLALRGEVDALGIVAADHPAVREAATALRAASLPVAALVSELAASTGAGYVGLDNRRVGRTAAWFVAQLARQPGAVALMVGSQRFQCQELCELSFRSFLREHSEDWELPAPRLTLEDETFAYENTLDLLSGQPDLAGLYVGGGGIEGVLRALREQRGARPVVVCHDLTPVTRAALNDGIVQVVLSHPLAELARSAVDLLVEAATGREAAPALPKRILPIQIDIPESV